MTQNQQRDQTQQETTGRDDRRGTVNPNDRPVPSSPEPDEQALKKGEETLERVKPY